MLNVLDSLLCYFSLLCRTIKSMDRPLAERMRPETLDAVVGQKHLLEQGQIIRQIVERQQPTSLILWGPPGTGKPTLAPLAKDDIVTILQKAAKAEKLTARRLPAKSLDLLAELSGGDARVALGNLELALQLTDKAITLEVITAAAQKRVPGYDKAGEQ